MINLTPTQLRKAANIQEKIQKLQTELGQLLGGPVQPATNAPRKRKMSPAGLKNIRAAQKARWAAIKAKKEKPVKKAKKKFTAAGRAALSAPAKARWAKAKKAGKRGL